MSGKTKPSEAAATSAADALYNAVIHLYQVISPSDLSDEASPEIEQALDTLWGASDRYEGERGGPAQRRTAQPAQLTAATWDDRGTAVQAPADEDRGNCVERMRELLSELGDQVEMVAAIEAPPASPAPDLALLNQLAVLVKDAYTEGWVTTGAYSSRDSWEKSAVSRRLCTLLGNITTEGGPIT